MPTEFPQVSIIIPTYNSGAVLERGIQSVLRQTYPHVELIVIDGGSNDQTPSVIQQYASRIAYWLSEPDQGVYDAMNKGLQQATGDWIYFMGSDDQLYDADVLKSIFSLPIPSTCQVIYGNVMSTRFNGLYDGEFTDEKIIKRNICHQAIFTSRQLFSELGNFDIQFRSHADWDFNLKWFFNRSIHRLYVDIIVAEYADGGMSSIQGDIDFAAAKMERALVYGRKHLPKPVLAQVYAALFFQYLKKRKYLKGIAYTCHHAFLSDERLFFVKSITQAMFKKLL